MCLQNDKPYSWNLEIFAPQWGYDQSREVIIRAAYGGAYETYGSKGDAGVWPVYRVPCDFCPVKSCITTCTNGEFATDYAVYSAVRDFFLQLDGKPELREIVLAGRPAEKQRPMQALCTGHMEHVRGRVDAGLPVVIIPVFPCLR